MSVLIWIQNVDTQTLIVLLKEFFEKVNFEKSQQMTTKAWKITFASKTHLLNISIFLKVGEQTMKDEYLSYQSLYALPQYR